VNLLATVIIHTAGRPAVLLLYSRLLFSYSALRPASRRKASPAFLTASPRPIFHHRRLSLRCSFRAECGLSPAALKSRFLLCGR